MEHVGFEKCVTAEGIARLLESAARIAPLLGEAEIAQTWACFRPGTPDGLPILGRWPGYENVIAATGHYRNGILLTPITGKVMAELVLSGTTSLPLSPFRPDRFAA
jgi:glycine oxidase